jgi:hypothetical protein
MTEADSNRERALAERASELFAESVAGLDGHTRSRLSRARAAAVAAAESSRRNPWLSPSRLVPLGGAAAALIAIVLISQMPEAPPAEQVVLNDLDLLLEGENLDLFEDLDFYAWLLEQPELLEGDG